MTSYNKKKSNYYEFNVAQKVIILLFFVVYITSAIFAIHFSFSSIYIIPFISALLLFYLAISELEHKDGIFIFADYFYYSTSIIGVSILGLYMSNPIELDKYFEKVRTIEHSYKLRSIDRKLLKLNENFKSTNSEILSMINYENDLCHQAFEDGNSFQERQMPCILFHGWLAAYQEEAIQQKWNKLGFIWNKQYDNIYIYMYTKEILEEIKKSKINYLIYLPSILLTLLSIKIGKTTSAAFPNAARGNRKAVRQNHRRIPPNE